MSEREQEREDSGHEYTGTARLDDVTHIVDHPEDYGFSWEKWDAQSRTDAKGNPFGALIVLRKDSATLPNVDNAQKFAKAFGWDKLTKAYNGTSGRVDAQQVTRTLILAVWAKDRGKSATERDIRVEVVKRILLGIRAKGGGGGSRKVWVVNGVTYATEEAYNDALKSFNATRFVALDGSKHPTGLEAKQASVAWLVDTRGMTPEIAATVVANMPE